MTDQSLFVDVYSVTTASSSGCPASGSPTRSWAATSARPRRSVSSTATCRRGRPVTRRPRRSSEFAEAADLDLSGAKTNADKLVAIEEAFTSGGDVQGGVVASEPAPVALDPLAPEIVAHVEASPVVDADGTTSTDDTESSDETAAAADEEN
jgi:hypothetical protein